MPPGSGRLLTGLTPEQAQATRKPVQLFTEGGGGAPARVTRTIKLASEGGDNGRP